jgi:hypothetical protein
MPKAQGQKLEHFGSTLGEVVRRAGVPYGYTLMTWSAGALCIRRFGLPDLPEVFLFLTGGSLGYGLAVGLARKISSSRETTQFGAPPPLWENILVVLPTIAVTYWVDRAVPGAGAGFLVVPLVATLLYLLGLAVVLVIRTGHKAP